MKRADPGGPPEGMPRGPARPLPSQRRNSSRFGTQTIRAQNSKQPLSLHCNHHGNWGKSKLGGIGCKKKKKGERGVSSIVSQPVPLATPPPFPPLGGVSALQHSGNRGNTTTAQKGGQGLQSPPPLRTHNGTGSKSTPEDVGSPNTHTAATSFFLVGTHFERGSLHHLSLHHFRLEDGMSEGNRSHHC